MGDLQQAFSVLMPDDLTVVHEESVVGGCISDARQVVTTDREGRRVQWFAKCNAPSFLGNFEAEGDGLTRLAATEAIASPKPEAIGVAADRSWLITRWIAQVTPGPDYFEQFGCALAELHRCTCGASIGLDRDNYLGAARQINQTRDRWVDFVAEHRIGFQLRWGMDQRLVDRPLRQACEQIIANLDQLLEGRREETSLLHGDLWSGNYLCNNRGRPVILDPAVYYGCREAEFGMLKLFGSCPPSFYQGYQQVFPLAAGWQRRVNVYVLYHLLNHLNLFGSGYHDQCRAMAVRILRQ